MPFENEKDDITLIAVDNARQDLQTYIRNGETLEEELFDQNDILVRGEEPTQKNSKLANDHVPEVHMDIPNPKKRLKISPELETTEDASTPLKAKPQQPQLQKKPVAVAHEKIAATRPSKTLKPVDKISAYAAEHKTEVKYDPKQHVLSDSSGIICQVPIASKPFNVKANPPKLANEFVFPNKELSPTGANFVENLLAEGPYELTCNKLETALNFMKSASKSKDFVKYIDNLTFPNKAPFNTPEALAAITEVKKQIVEQSDKIELKSTSPKSTF